MTAGLAVAKLTVQRRVEGKAQSLPQRLWSPSGSSPLSRDTAWAMSEENANVVRDFYEVLNGQLAAYWSDPEQPLNELPGLEEVFERLDPEVEWAWPLSPDTFRGRERVLQAVADWLDTVSDWRVEIEELIEGSRDRVLLIGRVVARGKGSGTPVYQPIFTAVTVRNGKVARIEDHTDRAKALEAAGLRE